MNQNDYLALFGRRIKTARAERRMTQEELARTIGVTKSAMSAYENGLTDPRVSLLPTLASALRVSVTWLATGENSVDIGTDPEKAQRIKEFIEYLEHKNRSDR